LKIIYTRRGLQILVDDADYEWLNQFTWRVTHDGYVERTIPGQNGKRSRTTEGIHRLITGCVRGDGVKVDHRNLNKLDNQRANLRVCTNLQNSYNRSKRGAKLKGITFIARLNLWQAAIRADKTSHYLGCFKTAEEAHEVYCLAADLLHGEFANHD
jgi:hypothetical protein